MNRIDECPAARTRVIDILPFLCFRYSLSRPKHHSWSKRLKKISQMLNGQWNNFTQRKTSWLAMCAIIWSMFSL